MRELTGDDYAMLTYLVLLLVVVGGSTLMASRRHINKTLQQAAIWLLIFVGLVGAYSLRDRFDSILNPERAVISESGTVSFTRAWDGHFYAEINVNGQIIEFVIDTGATDIVLNEADAERLGFNLSELIFSGRASTANGEVAIAKITLDRITLGRFADRNISASVNGGELDTSLLGMSYLSRFRKIEIAGSTLTLTR